MARALNEVINLATWIKDFSILSRFYIEGRERMPKIPILIYSQYAAEGNNIEGDEVGSFICRNKLLPIRIMARIS